MTSPDKIPLDNHLADIDPSETTEWIEALQSIIASDGKDRARYILESLIKKANQEGLYLGALIHTPYRNTINTADEKLLPPDEGMLKRLAALIRWNAVAMVLRAGKYAPELGGHIASYASASTLYEIGFNYFFKGPNHPNGNDLIYYQGHSSPGIYARAFLEGRLTENQLANFRQEVEKDGLSSYPHPWLMGDFWQFPTVSMGLGPIQAIYQARFLKYLENRQLKEMQNRKVWAFLGDGEMDEPESLGCISIAAREKLDNLIFVVNCNLQRLDGPVRGNSKIIQELEGIFRGAGWHVIKVVWGGRWDNLFAKDTSGIMQKRMEECVDGDYQAFKANDGAYVREHFFGQYPELKKMVEALSDEEIWRLNRGGHDPQKVYAAYAEAVAMKGKPVVILAKTIKGYGMGAAGDMQARGFLLGGTAGRTTLAGEGLQHQDGHSHVLASTIPNCVTYDPTYSYELAVIIHHGLERMVRDQENVFFYITVMNENYSHPAMPVGVEEGIIKGMYLLDEPKKQGKHHVQLLGSGTILREVIKAADWLKKDFDVTSDIWSVTSFNELGRDGLAVERHHRMHPEAKNPQQAYVSQQLDARKGPVIAATDYMRIYAEQIRPYINKNYVTLGTDGYGRSDTRQQLRHFFEVDAKYIVLGVLDALVREGELKSSVMVDAMKKYGIDPAKPDPWTV